MFAWSFLSLSDVAVAQCECVRACVYLTSMEMEGEGSSPEALNLRAGGPRAFVQFIVTFVPRHLRRWTRRFLLGQVTAPWGCEDVLLSGLLASLPGGLRSLPAWKSHVSQGLAVDEDLVMKSCPPRLHLDVCALCLLLRGPPACADALRVRPSVPSGRCTPDVTMREHSVTGLGIRRPLARRRDTILDTLVNEIHNTSLT